MQVSHLRFLFVTDDCKMKLEDKLIELENYCWGIYSPRNFHGRTKSQEMEDSDILD